MGKGDKKSRRGKITAGSYGVKRPRKQSKPSAEKKKEVVVAQEEVKSKAKKTKKKEEE